MPYAPVPLDLSARRNATWAPTIVLPYPGPQQPAIAHIAMQVRAYEGAPDAILTIADVAYTDTLASGTVDQPDEVRWLNLAPSADLTTIAQPQPNLGADQKLYHDVRLTYTDGVTFVWAAGAFLLSPGVTTV